MTKLSVFSAAVGPAMPSDTLNVFAVPQNLPPILFATGAALESDENGENTVHFVMRLGVTPQFIPGDPNHFNQSHALLDSDGAISDIFGVYPLGDENERTYRLAFISDPDPSLLTLDNGASPGFRIIMTRLAETQDSYNASQYLGFNIGAVPYTATFTSDREVPDGGTTLSLFGLASN